MTSPADLVGACPRSRILRGVVAVEIVVLVPAGEAVPHLDLEGVVREVLLGQCVGVCEIVPGEASVSAIEELTP